MKRIDIFIDERYCKDDNKVELEHVDASMLSVDDQKDEKSNGFDDITLGYFDKLIEIVADQTNTGLILKRLEKCKNSVNITHYPKILIK